MMTRTILRWVLALLLPTGALLATQPARAGDCRYIGQTCVEPAEVRNINGVAIYQDCWKYEAQYECIKPNSVNYCAALQSISTCYQTSSTCIERAFDGSCMKERRTYRCDDPSKPPPANTVVLDDTYTVTEKFDTAQCDPYKDDTTHCQVASHTCVEGAETRVINGNPIYKDCWKWEDEYTCVNPTPKNTCADLASNSACTKVSESCLDTDPKLGCTLKDIRYSCITKPGSSQTVTDCSTKTACVGTTCWETGSPPDSDFANAVIANEIGREAATYQSADGRLFTGIGEECRDGWGGLRDCCDASPGGKTNNNVLMKAGFSAATAVGKEAANIGSKYLFDFMYSGTEWATFVTNSGSQVAVNASTGATGAFTSTSYTPSVELYGLGWSAGAAPSGATALGNGFYFDPYSFAFAVAVQVIMSLTSCEPDEQQLGMHKGAGLSVYVGSYCSKKVLGACTQRSQAYCSFNSKLARIINEQGRKQLNKSWGDPRSPDCSGFSVEEFSKVDFSKVDMSEFIDDVMRATDVPDPGKVSDTIAGKMKGKTKNENYDALPKAPFGMVPVNGPTGP